MQLVQNTAIKTVSPGCFRYGNFDLTATKLAFVCRDALVNTIIFSEQALYSFNADDH